MSLWQRIRGKLTDDEPIADQKQSVLDSPMYKMGFLQLKDGRDEIVSSYGDFGLSPTNPIPVNGPEGETIYINRLRSCSGVGFMYHRVGSLKPANATNPIDQFELVSIDASERYILYFDMYYSRRSTKVPAGLTLIPWSKMDKRARFMCKLDCTGSTTTHLDNFPNSLPAYLESSNILKSLSPGLGKTMADLVRKFLSESF